jgi:hypothetical protein
VRWIIAGSADSPSTIPEIYYPKSWRSQRDMESSAMSRITTAPRNQTQGSRMSHRKSEHVMKCAAALFFVAAMVWLPVTARSETNSSDAARPLDTLFNASQSQQDSPDIQERRLEQMQGRMRLGVAGLPMTQVPLPLISSMKSLTMRSVEGPKIIPVIKTVSVWERIGKHRHSAIIMFLSSIAAWLLFRARHLLARECDRGLRWFDAQAMGVRRLVLVDDLDHNAVMTPAAVRQRGWTPDLMTQLLGRPDFAVVDPAGLNSPLVLISRARVEALERSGRFQSSIETQSRREREQDLRLAKWNMLHGECLPYLPHGAEEFQ